MRRTTLATTAVALLLACAASADRPTRNISSGRHPNLAAAQRHCISAFDKITDAQKANEWDMDGHAKKAKELLEQASEELKLAALAANTR